MRTQEKLKWPDCQLWFQLGLEDNSELECMDAPLPCHVGNYGFTATGYGKHVPTRRKVRAFGRWYRVYSTCYSNVASCYIKARGFTFYVG